MKRLKSFIIAITLFIFACLAISASVPKAMDYNLMLINPQTGHIMTNVSAEVRLELRQGSQDGTAVWSQNYSVKSDATGMVHITLDFSDNIDWDAAEYYLAMLIDNKEAGAAKLMSVPYAFVADRLSNVLTREELIGTWTYYWSYDYKDKYAVYTFNEDGTGNVYRYYDNSAYAITWQVIPNGAIYIDTGDKENGYYLNLTMKISSTKIRWRDGWLIKQ